MKTKVKICGIANLPDALAIAHLTPDYMGFVINYPKSPRNVPPALAQRMIAEIRKVSRKIQLVGVFVNMKPRDIREIAKKCRLDVIQLHGNESTEEIKEIRAPMEIWKSVTVRSPKDIADAEKFRKVVKKIHYDRGRGGGRAITRSLLKGKRIDILAGGLGVANVKSSMAALHPKIVDGNSKLESSPGKKDIKKVEKFITLVRSTT